MKISQPTRSPRQPLPLHTPAKTATVTQPRATKDTFETPRRNDGISGGSIALPSLNGLHSSAQPASTLTTKDPVAPATPGTAGASPTVTPDSFGREARLRSLLDSGLSGTDVNAPGRKTPFEGDGFAPTEADGKNATSTRGNASEGFLDLDALVTIAKGENTVSTPPDKEPPPAKEPSSPPLTLGRIWAVISRPLVPDGVVPGSFGGGTPAVAGTRTPNPETDTGDVHPGAPPATRLGAGGPSLVEATIAQRRQVTLPGEAQNTPARVTANHDVALKEGLRQRTDGRIDPGEQSTPTGSVSGPVAPAEGSGVEQVDGSRPGGPKHPDEG